MKVKDNSNVKNNGNQILQFQKNLIFQSCDRLMLMLMLMLVLMLFLTLIRSGRSILCFTENGSEMNVV